MSLADELLADLEDDEMEESFIEKTDITPEVDDSDVIAPLEEGNFQLFIMFHLFFLSLSFVEFNLVG